MMSTRGTYLLGRSNSFTPTIEGGYPPTNFPLPLLSPQAAPCASDQIQNCTLKHSMCLQKRSNSFALLDIAPREVQFLHPT